MSSANATPILTWYVDWSIFGCLTSLVWFVSVGQSDNRVVGPKELSVLVTGVVLLHTSTFYSIPDDARFCGKRTNDSSSVTNLTLGVHA